MGKIVRLSAVMLIQCAVCIYGGCNTACASEKKVEAAETTGPALTVPSLAPGSVKRISGRLFLAAQSCNERIIRVERDALTGAIILRALRIGETEVLFERVNHPVPLRLTVIVREKERKKSDARKGRNRPQKDSILVLPGWEGAANFTPSGRSARVLL